MIRFPAPALCRAFFALTLALPLAASAATLCVNPAGTAGCSTTISAAIAAAHPGDVIKVAPGTYKEQVTITIPLSLVGDPASPPLINAAGKTTGIFINGMAAAPAAGISGVNITGFKVENAQYEGILVANASNVTLSSNTVAKNNRALTPGSPCPNLAAYETSEAQDCGEGIHLMAVDHSIVINNITENNSGGMLITDETGPTTDNIIQGNTVRYNPYACGITLASHPPATALIPSAHLPFGLARNTIIANNSNHNGLGIPGAGAGVGIFAPFPGTSNTGNVVIDNDLAYNGLPGVTMHNHAFAPSPAPGVNLNDNKIIGNHIHANAADTADAATPGPTGINIYSVAPVTGTVITQNTFGDETIDIAFHVPAGQLDVHFNDFERGLAIDNLGAGTIDATQNWWTCASGPSPSCAYTTGPSILTAPWATTPTHLND